MRRVKKFFSLLLASLAIGVSLLICAALICLIIFTQIFNISLSVTNVELSQDTIIFKQVSLKQEERFLAQAETVSLLIRPSIQMRCEKLNCDIDRTYRVFKSLITYLPKMLPSLISRQKTEFEMTVTEGVLHSATYYPGIPLKLHYKKDCETQYLNVSLLEGAIDLKAIGHNQRLIAQLHIDDCPIEIVDTMLTEIMTSHPSTCLKYGFIKEGQLLYVHDGDKDDIYCGDILLKDLSIESNDHLYRGSFQTVTLSVDSQQVKQEAFLEIHLDEKACLSFCQKDGQTLGIDNCQGILSYNNTSEVTLNFTGHIHLQEEHQKFALRGLLARRSSGEWHFKTGQCGVGSALLHLKNYQTKYAMKEVEFNLIGIETEELRFFKKIGAFKYPWLHVIDLDHGRAEAKGVLSFTSEGINSLELHYLHLRQWNVSSQSFPLMTRDLSLTLRGDFRSYGSYGYVVQLQQGTLLEKTNKDEYISLIEQLKGEIGGNTRGLSYCALTSKDRTFSLNIDRGGQDTFLVNIALSQLPPFSQFDPFQLTFKLDTALDESLRAYDLCLNFEHKKSFISSGTCYVKIDEETLSIPFRVECLGKPLKGRILVGYQTSILNIEPFTGSLAWFEESGLMPSIYDKNCVGNIAFTKPISLQICYGGDKEFEISHAFEGRFDGLSITNMSCARTLDIQSGLFAYHEDNSLVFKNLRGEISLRDSTTPLNFFLADAKYSDRELALDMILSLQEEEIVSLSGSVINYGDKDQRVNILSSSHFMGEPIVQTDQEVGVTLDLEQLETLYLKLFPEAAFNLKYCGKLRCLCYENKGVYSFSIQCADGYVGERKFSGQASFKGTLKEGTFFLEETLSKSQLSGHFFKGKECIILEHLEGSINNCLSIISPHGQINSKALILRHLSLECEDIGNILFKEMQCHRDECVCCLEQGSFQLHRQALIEAFSEDHPLHRYAKCSKAEVIKGDISGRLERELFISDVVIEPASYLLGDHTFHLGPFHITKDSFGIKCHTEWLVGKEAIGLYLTYPELSDVVTVTVKQDPKEKGLDIFIQEKGSEFVVEKVKGRVLGLSIDIEQHNRNIFEGIVHLNLKKVLKYLPEKFQIALQDRHFGPDIDLTGRFFCGGVSEDLLFSGTLLSKNCVIDDYQFDQFVTNIKIFEDRVYFSDLRIDDLAGLFTINSMTMDKSGLFSTPEIEVYDLTLSKLKFSDQPRPQGSKRFVIQKAIIQDVRGSLESTKSITGTGYFQFMHQSKGVLEHALFKVPREIVSRIGLNPSVLTPSTGVVNFEIENGKYQLLSFKDVQSKGKISTFSLIPHTEENYIDFDGNLHLLVKIKQYSLLLKLTEPFMVRIEGDIKKPKYFLDRV